jgi:peptidoglycan/xylan/chitin deacetylase (PgdA/CDA1 family)
VLYTPLPLGAMTHVSQPEIPTFHEYPYVVENHALLVFIRDLLELAHGDCEFSPRPLWPQGARAAVCVTGDVHDYTGIGLPDRADREYRDMLAYMDILEKEGLEGRATLFVSGAVAAAHPQEVGSAIERGYEVCPHTYKDRSYSSLGLGFDQQKDDVERSIAAFRSVSPGHMDSARGFRTHGYNSNGITRAVLDSLDYDHICDLQGWDPDDVWGDDSGCTARYLSLPQAARGPRGQALRLLEAPDTVANDHFVYRVYKMSPDQALAYYKRQFDRIYRLGGLFLVCWHPYIALSEAPGRDETFRAALRYMADHADVAMLQVKELTSWWRHRLDPQGSTTA